MIIVFNIFIIGFALLIAYWWANQGLFSAILHLLCVIAAGAITLAFWEPLTAGLLLTGGGFDNFAWGVSFVMIFALSLLVLRIGTDKLVPANVDLPHWANLTFGFPVGLAAGVLTMGMFMIGSGFIQSRTQIMGYSGWTRASQTGVVREPRQRMWAPLHEWTVAFYETLSVGSLRSARPLRHYYPDLDQQAMSLVRDTYRDGRGHIALAPDAARVDSVTVDAQTNRYAVQMHFAAKARDFGEQLTLSQAQVRLICLPAHRLAAPVVVFPDRWIQDGTEYRFDSSSHYATSTPGQEAADIAFIFRVPPGEVPAFIQIKGTRFRLPTAQQGTIAAGALGNTAPGSLPPATATLGGNIDNAIRISNDIRPVVASKNTLPGGIKESDGFLTSGQGTFTRGGLRPSKTLRIEGIYEPAGTRVVQLDVSMDSPASIFGTARQQAGAGARLSLVDDQGRTYSPMGYIHEQPSIGTTIRLEPRDFVATMDDLPALPTSGSERLKLLFTVTEDAVITGFRFGEILVGSCNTRVEKRSSR